MDQNDDATRIAKAIMEFRRERRDELPEDIFNETAWEFLLALFIADSQGERLTGRIVSERIDASPAVAARWLKYLSKEGLVVGDGEGDLDDTLTLSAIAIDRMERLFEKAQELRRVMGRAS